MPRPERAAAAIIEADAVRSVVKAYRAKAPVTADHPVARVGPALARALRREAVRAPGGVDVGRDEMSDDVAIVGAERGGGVEDPVDDCRAVAAENREDSVVAHIGLDVAPILVRRRPLRRAARVLARGLWIAGRALRSAARDLRFATARGRAARELRHRRLAEDGRHNAREVEADALAHVVERERVRIGGYGAHKEEEQQHRERDAAQDPAVVAHA